MVPDDGPGAVGRADFTVGGRSREGRRVTFRVGTGDDVDGLSLQSSLQFLQKCAAVPSGTPGLSSKSLPQFGINRYQ